MRRRVVSVPVLGFAALLVGSIAFADGECGKGYRDTTAGERATMTANLEAARGVLPGAPAGWVVDGDDAVRPILSLCRDYEEGPWGYSFNRDYRRTTGFEARDSLLQVAGSVARAEQEANQPAMEALQARMTALAQQAAEAAQQGDMARAEAINQEMVKLGEEFQKLFDSGGTADALAAVEEASRDEYFSVAVEFNAPRMWHDPAGVSLDLPGAAAAYRWGEKGDGMVVVLVGSWAPDPDRGEGMDACPLRAGEKAETAQSVVVRIHGDATRVESVARSIDLKPLAALLR